MLYKKINAVINYEIKTIVDNKEKKEKLKIFKFIEFK